MTVTHEGWVRNPDYTPKYIKRIIHLSANWNRQLDFQSGKCGFDPRQMYQIRE